MFNTTEYNAIQKPIVNVLLVKMGFSQKTPRVVVFSPSLYRGLGLTDLREEIFFEHLLSFIKDMRSVNLQAEKRNILLDMYQLILGSDKNFLELNATDYPHVPRNNKLTFLWKHHTNHSMTIRRKDVCTPSTNYANDIAIMDGITQAKISRAVTTQFLSDSKINVVRTFLRVHHLSEILDEDGNINEDYFQV